MSQSTSPSDACAGLGVADLWDLADRDVPQANRTAPHARPTRLLDMSEAEEDAWLKKERLRQRGWFQTVEEFEATADVKWAIDGLIRIGGLHMLYADTGLGKTHVALALAAYISEGRWWGDRAVTQMPVYYVCGEGAQGFKERVLATSAHSGRVWTHWKSERAPSI